MIKVTETGLLLKGNLPSILSETACILRNVHKKTIDKLGPEFGEILYQKNNRIGRYGWRGHGKGTWEDGNRKNKNA